MTKKLTDDEKLRRYGIRLQKALDKALKEGKVTIVDYRDASWHALQMAKPRDHARIVGL